MLSTSHPVADWLASGASYFAVERTEASGPEMKAETKADGAPPKQDAAKKGPQS